MAPPNTSERLPWRALPDAQLLLERVIWATDCWVDGKPVGHGQSLIAPHVFSVGSLAPGKHTITLRVDNRKQYDTSFSDFAHAYTDGTQIIWNGVIGRLEIRARPVGSIQRVKIEPALARKIVRATVALTGARPNGAYLQARVRLGGRVVASSRKIALTGATEQPITVALAEAQTWDEFRPRLYRLEVEVRSKGG